MFDKSTYKREFYVKNKTQYLANAKQRYALKKESIKAQRQAKRLLETSDERQKRLEFHRQYNRKHVDANRTRSQTNESKYSQYKFSAQRRGHKFDLLLEEFSQLFHASCSYCGVKESRGIDRVDNFQGYTITNSVACCETCNRMKLTASRDEFLSHIKRIHLHTI